MIILALPRTGTRMLVSALGSHPDIPKVVHEFRGTEDEFKSHPYVLSNYWRDFFTGPVIHVYREDAIAGARSMLLMSYKFPDDVVDLPVSEVRTLAEKRKEWDREFSRHADHSISYEEITGGEFVTEFDEDVSGRFCDWFGVNYRTLKPVTTQSRKIRLRNEKWLAA